MRKRYRPPHRIKRKRSFLRNRFFWLGLFLFILFLGLIWLLFLSPFFQVKNIEIGREEVVAAPGVETISSSTAEMVSLIAEEEVARSFLFFPARSILLVSGSKIEKKALERFIQIENISVEKKFPDGITISLSGRKGVANYCYYLEDQEICLLLDKDGMVFEESDDEAAAYLVKIFKSDSFEINLRQNPVNAEEIEKVLNIQNKVAKGMGMPLERFLFVSSDRLNVLTKEGWEIYFSLTDNIDWQITKLKAVLNEKIPSERRKDLEYVELRFGNMASFKY